MDEYPSVPPGLANLNFLSRCSIYMSHKITTLACLAIISVAGSASAALADDPPFSGNASWYGARFNGKKTASGELFDMNKLSGAHKTLPLGSKVLIENPKNGKSTVVKVNDRGPFVRTRVMDLSRAGADNLGYLSHGTAHLDFTPISKKSSAPPNSSAADKTSATATSSADKEK